MCATAEQPTDKYPISLHIVSAKQQSDGTSTVIHGQRPAYCNNPGPGLQTRVCSATHPSDTVIEGSILVLTAVVDSKTYTLDCLRCRMLETGEYPARRDGSHFIVLAHKLDKQGNKTSKEVEIKLRIVGEEAP